jgi:hypothetical protein
MKLSAAVAPFFHRLELPHLFKQQQQPTVS